MKTRPGYPHFIATGPNDTPEAQCSRCRQTFDRRDLDERGECGCGEEEPKDEQ